jgi:hypothetical protein
MLLRHSQSGTEHDSEALNRTFGSYGKTGLHNLYSSPDMFRAKGG